MTAPPSLAVLGFGDLGSALVRAAHDGSGARPRVWNRDRPDPVAWRRAVQDAGGVPAATLAEALLGGDVVLACAPASAALDLAELAAAHLEPGAVYADLSSGPPELKQQCAAAVAQVGARFADGAVLGAVAAAGGAVPVLASGDGAEALAAAARRLGLDVTAVAGPAGTAARVKLLRSVYLKGRDALVAEMVAGARAHGVEQLVLESIRGPGEEVSFPELAARVLASLERHAVRRADELGACAQLLAAAGVDPVATVGAQRRLRRVAGPQD